MAQGISQLRVLSVLCTHTGSAAWETDGWWQQGQADLSWFPHEAELEHPCVAELWQDVLPLAEVDVSASWALIFVGFNSLPV